MIRLFETDKAGLYSSPDRVRYHYHQDGAVLVRDVVPQELLNTVSNQISHLETQLEQRWNLNHSISANCLSDISDRLVQLEKLHPGSQSILYDTISHTPALHQFASDEAITAMAKIILSQDIVIHPRLIVLMSMPQASWHLAQWHQDYYYNEGPEDTLTVYAPLQKTSVNNGSLLLALAEHKNGLLAHGHHQYETKWHTIQPKAVTEFANVVETTVNQGDVLLFHSLTPHSARLNTSNMIRFVINLRYRDLRDRQYITDDWRIKEISHARSALNAKQQG